MVPTAWSNTHFVGRCTWKTSVKPPPYAAVRAVHAVWPFCQNGLTSYVKGITVKLPDTTLRRLRQEARATGRSVAALIRERLETAPHRAVGWSMTSLLILRVVRQAIESL